VQPLSVDINSFCQMVGIGRSKAFALIRSSEVDVVRLSRKTLVTVDSIERMLARNMVQGRR
jgi:hypothetical protein